MRRPSPLVLVVDDNEDARELYGLSLEHYGFRCCQAADGLAAIAQAKSMHPDIILMDATMPVLDGWQAAKALKTDPSTKTIPVIMLTAHAFDEHRAKAAEVGAEGFVAKPALPDALAKEIHRVLRKS